MAKILNQEEQQKALKNINDSIRDLKKGNEILQADNPSGIFTISFTDSAGKRHRAEIHVQSKKIIDQLYLDFKQEEKERIQKLASDNLIDLDDEDIETLDYDGSVLLHEEQNAEEPIPEV